MTKQRFNPLGLLSLLALIALLGRFTGEPGWYGFLGFAYYLRYFAVQPDELFRQNFQRAAAFAFLGEMVALVPLAFLCLGLYGPAKAAATAFALSFAVAVFAFTGALQLLEWRERRGAAE